MFANKVVLITDVSSAIGQVTAFHFAKERAILVITGRDNENLETVAESCMKESPTNLKPFVIVADLNEESDIEKVIKLTIQRLATIDVLVNNGSIMSSGAIEKTTLDQYDKIMATNVRIPFYLTKLAVPYLTATKGNIVNVSSMADVRSNTLAYSLSTAAMDHFTKCLALELGPQGVRVNAVNLGVITKGTHFKGVTLEEANLVQCEDSHSLRTLGVPDEVASTIVFLASKRARKITGVTLPVGGVVCNRFRREVAWLRSYIVPCSPLRSGR